MTWFLNLESHTWPSYYSSDLTKYRRASHHDDDNSPGGGRKFWLSQLLVAEGKGNATVNIACMSRGSDEHGPTVQYLERDYG